MQFIFAFFALNICIRRRPFREENVAIRSFLSHSAGIVALNISTSEVTSVYREMQRLQTPFGYKGVARQDV